MPSRKGFEQAAVWLKSKMAERDTLDAVNAEICYNVMMDLKKRKDAIGAIYHRTKVENDRKKDELEQLYTRMNYTPVDVDLPEEWLEDDGQQEGIFFDDGN